MALSYEDYAPRLHQINAAAANRRRQQEQIRHGVAVTFQELINEPRWKLWADHIEVVKQRYEHDKKQCEDKLTASVYLDPKEYGQLKLNHARALAYMEALNFALTFAKDTIEQDKKATEQDNAGSVLLSKTS